MIFMGRTFCGARNTLDYTATDVSNINSITLTNAIFDELFITKNTDIAYGDITQNPWDYDTIMSAHFNGNLHGGNIEYSAEQVSHIRIKRRKKNTYQWTTLYEVPINTYEDFIFERRDSLARGNKTEYEFAFIPVINNIEGNISIGSVVSDFDGMYLIEKDIAFGTVLDVKQSNIRKNKPSAIITTLGSQYPTVVSNGESNYYSGTIAGTFIEKDIPSGGWDVNNGFRHRERLMEFINDGKPKFLKTNDGRAWIVKIVGSATESENGHYQNVSTSMDWVELGNCESGNDLYCYNLIDVNIEGV